MVASAALCLIGTIASKGRRAIIAAAVMALAMIDLAYTAVIPPVVWSGALLLVGLCMAVSLRSGARNPTPRLSPALVSAPGRSPEVAAGGCDDSPTASEHCRSRGPRPGPATHLSAPAAVLSAIAYPVMAWQVINHGAHMSGSAHHGSGGHGHHAGDISLISTFLTLAVVVLAVCLVICAVHDFSRRRPLVSLDCWGMAAMIMVMQFLH